MGAGSSKPADGSTSSKHVFSSSSPIQFSANLVEALQSSAETDSTRAKSLELQIQARVAEELERLRAREQQTLAEIEKRLLAEGVKEDTTSALGGPTKPTTAYAPPAGSLDLDAPRVPFAGRDEPLPPSVSAFPGGDTVSTQQQQQQPPAVNREVSRHSVMSEIEQLRQKLDSRRRLVELDEGVEKAKQEVVTCLRLNDRRPLDCWKEVEEFKREVARLEQAFVDRVVG